MDPHGSIGGRLNWVTFVPEASDRLVATLAIGSNSITSLLDDLGEVEGIGKGFVDGDLQFFGSTASRDPNPPEFRVVGTFFDVPQEEEDNA